VGIASKTPGRTREVRAQIGELGFLRACNVVAARPRVCPQPTRQLVLVTCPLERKTASTAAVLRSSTVTPFDVTSLGCQTTANGKSYTPRGHDFTAKHTFKHQPRAASHSPVTPLGAT
jgi:hypothetical protein